MKNKKWKQFEKLTEQCYMNKRTELVSGSIHVGRKHRLSI